jgi:hypothetical protein
MKVCECQPGDIVTGPNWGYNPDGSPFTCKVEEVKVYGKDALERFPNLEAIAFFEGGGFWRVSQLRKLGEA